MKSLTRCMEVFAVVGAITMLAGFFIIGLINLLIYA